MSASSRLDLEVGLSSVRKTAHEIVLETLRYAILRGQVTGGSRIVQADVAAQLGVSVTPVREALRDLAAEGLVRLDPHRGAVVQAVSGDELVEIIGLRQLLEVDLMRRAAAHIGPDVLARARAVHERMLVTPDPASWSALNRDFHLTIYRAAGLERQFEMVRSLLDASMLFVHVAQHEQSSRARADADHGRILELLDTGDVDGVCDVLSQHITIPLDGPVRAEITPRQ